MHDGMQIATPCSVTDKEVGIATHAGPTFGEIVNRLGDSYRSDAEVAAIVAQLLHSGRARLTGKWAGKRIVVRPSLETFLEWVRSKAGGRVNNGKRRQRQVQTL
jgi:hypothetical protein